MATNKFLSKILPKNRKQSTPLSFIRSLVSGSFYKLSDLRGVESFANIKTQIETMRALAKDSQISTALSYYATDATTMNNAGQIIWATAIDKNSKDVADVINTLFKRWKVNDYARDHILELATIGNLYMPTTLMYSQSSGANVRKGVVLDNNTIPDKEFDIVPSYKIPPETILHLWKDGKPCGYLQQPDEQSSSVNILPESACIHFALGGLLGDYTYDVRSSDGSIDTYDIQFAQPLMEQAVQPTQTLSLLEDAIVLSSLARVIKFINVECGSDIEDDEVRDILEQIKNTIEQQLSLNTLNGDSQSFVNPQSPNNLIYLPRVNGSDAISVTDLNMAEANQTDNELLEHYQNKKLSVLGVPKEAMNFSSSEGLGGAGAVLSQRSQLYANALQRLETAYKAGWTNAINTYLDVHGYSGFVDKYTLHMNPIVTVMSTVVGEKRDAALSQAMTFIDMIKNLGVNDKKVVLKGLKEILSEEFPSIASEILTWMIDLAEGGVEGEI